MRRPSDHTIVQGIITPFMILRHHFRQIFTLGFAVNVEWCGQAAELPVRPDKADPKPCQCTANDGVNRAWQTCGKGGTIQIEVDQGQNGDKGGCLAYCLLRSSKNKTPLSINMTSCP